MNILTFDIEDWFHILDNASSRSEVEWARYAPRVEANTDRILQLLSDTGTPATFFCLGWVAEQHPEVLRRIQAAGHEIASHSHRHQLIYEQSPDEFRSDLERSLRSIEDVTGVKVRAYRAPGFSITQDNLWALNILQENGIEVDSSVFPASRSHGGLPSYGVARPSVIEHGGARLREFPINCARVGGMRIMFSGGGYFRVLPYSVIHRWMKQSDYTMTYFHPRDFDPDQPVLPGLKAHRRFKSYVGLRSAFAKLQRLLSDFEFTDLRGAEQALDWSAQPTVRV